MASRDKKAERQYWSDLPVLTLLPLLAAVASIFAATGFLSDMLDGLSRPASSALFLSIYTGVFAGVLFLTALRWRKWLAPVVIIFVVVTIYIASHSPSSATTLTDENRARLRLEAALSIALLSISYALSLVFVTRQGVKQIRFDTEMKLAESIQRNLVPDINSRIGAVEVCSVSKPGSAVGGDLVDVIPLDQGLIAYLADVSGHGVPAAMLTSAVKTAARSAVEQMPSVTALLEHVNRVLPAVKSPNMYATCAAVHIGQEGACTYALAGHLPILHVSRATGRCTQLTQGGPPLGLLFHSRFPGAEIQCEQGDLLVLLSDGLVEVADRKDRQFGFEGIERAVTTFRQQPLVQIRQAVMDAVAAHGQQDDDQSLLLLRIL